MRRHNATRDDDAEVSGTVNLEVVHVQVDGTPEAGNVPLLRTVNAVVKQVDGVLVEVERPGMVDTLIEVRRVLEVEDI